MYNLSPRICTHVNPQTPTYVGPTTYIICSERDKRVNRAPFLSSKKRVPTFFNPSFCNELYDTQETERKIKSGSSPRNRSDRFVNAPCDTPGPGEYNLDLDTKCGSVRRTKKGRGRLYLCRVPYTVKGSAPSIPTSINENGYDIDKDGNIIRIPPRKKEITSIYNIKSPEFGERYRGCKWASQTGKRSTYTTNANPGPGTYEVQFPKCRRAIEDEKFREMARLFTFLPRYIEEQEIKFKKEGMPGPGQHNLGKLDVCKKCPGIKPTPFITASERFKEDILEGPSPACYDIVTVKDTVSKNGTPFSVQSSRFPRKKVEHSPGPGYYDVKSPLTEKLEGKRNKYVLYTPPFNQTAERNTTEIKKDAACTPSPAEYSLDGEKHCKIFVSSVFKSKVRRFPRLCRKFNEASPAHYDAMEAFNDNKDPKSHNIFEVSFNATGERKGILSDLNYDNPSAADYLSQGNLSSKGHFIPSSLRFKESKEKTPGPGTYRIHPVYDYSMYGAYNTYNLHIKENVIKRKLRRSPKETWAKWAAGLKKKKQLRCFQYIGMEFITS